MAKITARGATEVARINFTTEGGATGILVLRSDRKVLRRWTGDLKSGYSIMGTLKADTFLDGRALAAIAVRRNWTITKKEG